jgi:cold-inducible RNA-binding protein
MATKSLYVGNIPHGATEQELRDLFNDFGPVGDVRIIEGKGFAFVDLPAENVANAIAALNGQDFSGRALRIDEARPRRERTGGGGEGGGRRFGGGGGGGYGGGGGGGRRGGGGRGRDRDW